MGDEKTTCVRGTPPHDNRIILYDPVGSFYVVNDGKVYTVPDDDRVRTLLHQERIVRVQDAPIPQPAFNPDFNAVGTTSQDDIGVPVGTPGAAPVVGQVPNPGSPDGTDGNPDGAEKIVYDADARRKELNELTRPQVDELAESLGIANAAKAPNKGIVIESILDHEIIDTSSLKPSGDSNAD